MGCYLLTGFVELVAFIAPAIIGDSSSLHTFLGRLEHAEGYGVNEIGSHKEGVGILTSELKGVLALTNTVTCGQTLSLKDGR